MTFLLLLIIPNFATGQTCSTGEEPRLLCPADVRALVTEVCGEARKKAAQRDQAIGQARKWRARADQQAGELIVCEEIKATHSLLRDAHARARTRYDMRWIFRGMMFLAGASTALAVGCGFSDCSDSITAGAAGFGAVMLVFTFSSDWFLGPD